MGWDPVYAEYAAKGWPSIDPSSPDYCYRPCKTGVHVCGQHPDGDNCMTVLNLPAPSPAEAIALFSKAKAELAEAENADTDFIVDLMINGDCDCDFPMNRQMLERLRALAAQDVRQN